jgi:hypothetical protein
LFQTARNHRQKEQSWARHAPWQHMTTKYSEKTYLDIAASLACIQQFTLWLRWVFRALDFRHTFSYAGFVL